MREGRREKAGGGLPSKKGIKILEKMKLLNLIKKQTVNQTMNAFYVQVPPSDCPHHLIHRTDTDMEIPTCILLLLMFMTSLSKSAPILTVREIEGSLTVKEKALKFRLELQYFHVYWKLIVGSNEIGQWAILQAYKTNKIVPRGQNVINIYIHIL